MGRPDARVETDAHSPASGSTSAARTTLATNGSVADAIPQRDRLKPDNTDRDEGSNRRLPLVTTRVGIIYVVATVSLLLCALVSQAAPEHHRLHSLMWVTAIAVCSFGGLVSMRSVRTLRTIERELRRNKGNSRRWQTSRPVIGVDSVTEGWNQLLEDVAVNFQSSLPARVPATLDQEVVTLARAMRDLPIAWIITDADGRIKFLGPAATGLLALPDDDNHSGRDLPELLHLRDETDPSAAAALQQLMSPVRMVNQRRVVNIKSRPVQLRIARSRLGGRSGDGEGMAWVLADVTQQQLATEARDQFLMTATHELRTPLSNLHAYAEALQETDGLDLERQKEFCNVITSEAHRLSRLVDQLLTVSQMEAGSMVANRHELEMLPMVEYAADQLRGQAEQKQIKLSTNLSAKLPTVFGDRDKLQAALTNLVGNAIKYTPSGGEVVVRCAAEDRWIRVDVVDNGPGISAEEQPQVFNKFFRGKLAEESDQRGNGLGLAFAREVARIHGGEVELDSVLGEGSTFTIRLPMGGQSRSGV